NDNNTTDNKAGSVFPDGDKVCKETYSNNYYTVTYKLDGAEYFAAPYESAVETVKYNAAVSVRPKAIREGHTVTDWSFTPALANGKMPASDVIANASSNANVYTLTVRYVMSDGKNELAPATYTESVVYGKAYSVASPAVTGYTPDKAKVEGTMDSENGKTVTVTYSPNKYNLTVRYVMSDGKNELAPAAYTENVVFGKGYSVASPAVTGYTPDKAKVEGTMGAENITETVTYSPSIVYEEGTASITLSAFAEPLNIKEEEQQAVDVILVIDTSNSMIYYRMDSGKTRLQELKDKAAGFINTLNNEALLNDADYRVAMVSFNSTATRLTGTSDKDAFLDVVSDKELLLDKIENLNTNSGTKPDQGLQKAKAILAANNNDGRKKTVVFLTDGVPSPANQDGFDTSYANAAIGVANEIKNTYETEIYAVGVSLAANPGASLVANPITETEKMNKFMHFVSSNYKEAAQMSDGGNKTEDVYFVTAKDSEGLKKIFDYIAAEQNTKTITPCDVTICDTISEYFTLTAEQEEALRSTLRNEYEVPDENVIITRSDRGTVITIKNVTPKPVYENGIQTGYGISITFEVSANEKSHNAGFYRISPSEQTADGKTAAKFIIPDNFEISDSRMTVKYMSEG
ncbi:MAG: VWA domain-containing protein, partial [Clostridia bacterium]|nr:VWA domain-containing protein [Clostridia bacterium]